MAPTPVKEAAHGTACWDFAAQQAVPPDAANGSPLVCLIKKASDDQQGITGLETAIVLIAFVKGKSLLIEVMPSKGAVLRISRATPIALTKYTHLTGGGIRGDGREGQASALAHTYSNPKRSPRGKASPSKYRRPTAPEGTEALALPYRALGARDLAGQPGIQGKRRSDGAGQALEEGFGFVVAVGA